MSYANFKKAFVKMQEWEGGYSNHPRDIGGETYRGISRRAWPNWSGWSVLDAAMRKYGTDIAGMDRDLRSNGELNDQTETFYLENFWFPCLAGIESFCPAQLARKLFDTAVNIGVRGNPKYGTKGACEILQEALNAVLSGRPSLIVDGIIGPKTRADLKEADLAVGARLIVATYCEIQANYYRRIVARNPSQDVFLGGWLRRAADMCEDKEDF